MINLIASVVLKDGKLCIGHNNDLLFKISEDLKNFKRLTENNVVVMGRKTWESLGCKPLKNRINIVLSNKERGDMFRTFEEFKTNIPLLTMSGQKIFVIGGAEIYNLFLKEFPMKLYITLVKCKLDYQPDTWIDDRYLKYYKLESFSEEKKDKDLTYRYLTYELLKNRHQEYKYLKLMSDILENGNFRDDRTGVGTVSLFGTSMKFDISKTIPMMTTRSTPFRVILEELLFFCRGDTDAKILQNKNVKIWNGNTTRNFLDKRGLTEYDEGIMGPIYGFQWRFFGADYKQEYSNTKNVNRDEIGGTDQLKNVEYLLKNDPYSRRIVISAWNPNYTDKMVLAPCHILLQFYVEEINGVKHLSCQFYQRSSDQLAFCFNVVSYSILTHILAKKCDMVPKDIVYVAGDCHIYKNHIESVKQQLNRNVRPFPALVLNEPIKDKSWEELETSDFELVGYIPHPSIKMNMAI